VRFLQPRMVNRTKKFRKQQQEPTQAPVLIHHFGGALKARFFHRPAIQLDYQ
jgi:hypothetical protein